MLLTCGSWVHPPIHVVHDFLPAGSHDSMACTLQPLNLTVAKHRLWMHE